MLHLMSCCHRSRTTFHERQSDFPHERLPAVFGYAHNLTDLFLVSHSAEALTHSLPWDVYYTSQKRPSGWWPRTYIYVQPQFRFFAFVTARPLTWRLLHASEVSSSSVICLSSVRSGENLHIAKHKSVRRLFRSPN